MVNLQVTTHVDGDAYEVGDLEAIVLHLLGIDR